jgi:D-sedoheptulose 7-phosphate isomerase
MPATFAAEYKSSLLKALETVDLHLVDQAIQMLGDARERDATIFVCGNGGSASTASHFVCDMVKGASFGRQKRFRIMALTDSLATITAYSNDVGYDCIFAEQLRNFARPGDLLLAISGSGNSPNVVQAVEYANRAGCQTMALTGRDGGKLAHAAQLEIRVTEPHMGRIEDAHLMVCHMLCYRFMEHD